MAARIVVLISGAGSNMHALARACRAGDVPGEVVAVVADRPCEGLELARSEGVEAAVLDPRGYATREEWSEALLELVKGFAPDLVVSAGFMRILSPVFVHAYSGRLINLHPSLLPAYPGAHAVRDALEDGATVTGSTVHFVDDEVDHGPVILQREVRIEPDDDERSLHERIKAVEHGMLAEACRMVLDGRAALEGRPPGPSN
ncbi:MAG TPA: phosphoribosylglycinamide formyltransferase [Actinomycetota bacterium]|nr:phosphoribosylglycinamide formyltransferase [Actinomycetota bacterium]